MTTICALRRTIKAVAEHIVDTPGSAPGLTGALLQLVQAEATHAESAQGPSPETTAKICELQRAVKALTERINFLESLSKVKTVELR
jgi:hypothetical protein